MEHGGHLVALVDEYGAVVGAKLRRDIDKAHDAYHTVFTLLVTPAGEVVLGNIPARDDLPNLYAHLLGAPVATIRRNDELPLAAAQRSVERELLMEHADLTHVGEALFRLPHDRRTYASVYYVQAELPAVYSRTDIAGLEVMTPDDLRGRILRQPEQFAPTFLELWRRYQDRLPL